MTARLLMVQGTGSDVGKSLIVAALCRAYVRRGLRVRPFKPQNMSNNAAVTGDGGEIGRAQAVQARAAGVVPSRHMNPVLLKPDSDRGAQVVVQGRVQGRAAAGDYQALKPTLMGAVLESLEVLATEADLVLVEGAGSPSEMNLRQGDIANMGFATRVGCPVVLVGDIDRGGVLAQIVGTHALLPPEERELIVGYLINRLRGDPGLFTPAIDIIGRHVGWPCLGVVPWHAAAARLPAEDSMALERGLDSPAEAPLRVVVPRLSRIANFDDLDPLKAEPGVALEIVPPGRALPPADLIVLPGSKATLGELALLAEQGWDHDIRAHHARGGRVIGLCAGFQMLGREVRDPDGLEGRPGRAPGLGLLDMVTTISPAKTLRSASGTTIDGDLPVAGYEMHMGVSEGPALTRPWLRLSDPERLEGAVSADGRVRGSYLHGLLDSDALRAHLLGVAETTNHHARVEQALDQLAGHLESHVDLDALLARACPARGAPPP
ncbi:cobyric acid synthase [Roseospirillum parvum]|uniref:Cobyric acid synthase n=1 Tax=Roseospirillum parvum TaxID=83401 RepID=A0A1G7Z7R3_9PROT|nr:cobyric acid synthase [Roseospirillum parvum]SDH04781.1 adenosylcobyric acid synthase [Roseospirillum parvum]